MQSFFRLLGIKARLPREIIIKESQHGYLLWLHALGEPQATDLCFHQILPLSEMARPIIRRPETVISKWGNALVFFG